MTAGGAVRWLLTTRSGGVLISSVVAAAISATATYVALDKKLAKKYEEKAESDLLEARAFYRQLAEDGAFSKPEEVSVPEEEPEFVQENEAAVQASLVEESVRIMQQEGYISYDKMSKDTKPAPEAVIEVTASLQKNIWDENQATSGIDLEDVAMKKGLGRPYIITEDEFVSNDLDWGKEHITWFESDEKLVGEDDELIPDVDQLLDLSNLRFGVGTKDTNAVYIASSNSQTLYEVTRSLGSYAAEMLGQGIEEDFEYGPPLRKFRKDD